MLAPWFDILSLLSLLLTPSLFSCTSFLILSTLPYICRSPVVAIPTFAGMALGMIEDIRYRGQFVYLLYILCHGSCLCHFYIFCSCWSIHLPFVVWFSMLYLFWEDYSLEMTTWLVSARHYYYSIYDIVVHIASTVYLCIVAFVVELIKHVFSTEHFVLV